MDDRGGIDVEAWITAIVGFSLVWIVWTTMTPAIDKLTVAITGPSLNLPIQSINLAYLVQKVWSYGMIINAGGWLLYILWSSIRQEVAEQQYEVRY
jgi:hypothetical protein